MKKIVLFCLLPLFSSVFLNLHAQELTLPVESLISLDQKPVAPEVFNNNGKPVIISFWATWCGPCVNELSTIAKTYSIWQKESGVKLIAISIDRVRQLEKVKSFIKDKKWDYEVYMDQTGDFREALNVVNIPHTFVLDANGKIVYQSTTYSPEMNSSYMSK